MAQTDSAACVPLMRHGAGPGSPGHADPDQESCCCAHLERLVECRSTHFLNVQPEGQLVAVGQLHNTSATRDCSCQNSKVASQSADDSVVALLV